LPSVSNSNYLQSSAATSNEEISTRYRQEEIKIKEKQRGWRKRDRREAFHKASFLVEHNSPLIWKHLHSSFGRLFGADTSKKKTERSNRTLEL